MFGQAKRLQLPDVEFEGVRVRTEHGKLCLLKIDARVVRKDNRVVTRVRAVALVCAFLLPAAVVCDGLIRFALSVEAYRCCASTGGECAKLSTPDECCKTQEQAASQGFTSVAPDTRVRFASDLSSALPVTAFQVARVEMFERTGPSATDRFTRPHDPPHLHPFPLLI